MAGNVQYIVQPLGKQDRAAFHCGDESLDKYLVERASRDVRENLSAVFVLLACGAPDAVLGYYTLSSREIDAGDIPDELKKRAGRYNRVGATLIGRLAVAKEQQGRGLGELLLLDALQKSLESTKRVAAFRGHRRCQVRPRRAVLQEIWLHPAKGEQAVHSGENGAGAV